MRRFVYSVDTDQFQRIREDGKVYVDKTAMIYDLVNVKNLLRAFDGRNIFIFSLLNSKVDTEVKSVKGRADVVIKTKNEIYVLELKVDDSVDNALSQIDSTDYAIPYESDERKVTKCGVSISSEARNIVHWRSIDEEGNIIDEQKF